MAELRKWGEDRTLGAPLVSRTCQLVVFEDVLNAPRAGHADAGVDRERLLEVVRGFGSVVGLQVALPESFQRPSFFEGQLEITCDGQGLAVELASSFHCRGACGKLTKPVERLSLAKRPVELTE